MYNEKEEEDLPCGDDVTSSQYELLKVAYRHQCAIGWDHFITGRITKKWSEYYGSNLQDNDEKNGKIIAFSRNVVKATWRFTISVWGSHNEQVHGKNNKYSSRNVRSIKKCIDEIYDNFKNIISTEDQWLFREEARIRREQPVPQMIGWLERVLLCLVDMQDADDIVKRSTRFTLQNEHYFYI